MIMHLFAPDCYICGIAVEIELLDRAFLLYAVAGKISHYCAQLMDSEIESVTCSCADGSYYV